MKLELRDTLLGNEDKVKTILDEWLGSYKPLKHGRRSRRL